MGLNPAATGADGSPVNRAVARDAGESTLDVVWGLGSGRRARVLLREGRRVEILAIDVEPDRPDRVRAVIDACERLRAAEAEARLRVVVGSAATFAARWHELGAANTGITVHVDLAALSAVPMAARELARVVERLHLERADLHRFAETMRRNLADNVEAMAGAASLSTWTGATAGRPGFVVAAGPSARAAMPWLSRARALGPVIAVDTALPLCREFGVALDVLASVDPHAASRIHLQCGTDDVHALAFQPYCAPAVVAAFDQRVLAVPTGDLLCDRAAARLDLPSVPTCGTVLLYALQIAEVLGCDPIVMIGTDFAHVDGRTHAVGTATGRDATPLGVTVADCRGAAVPTTSALRRFLGDIEHHIAATPARHWLVDGGGAHVAGTRVTSPAAIARWVQRHGRSGAAGPWLPSVAADDDLARMRRAAIWQRLRIEFDAV